MKHFFVTTSIIFLSLIPLLALSQIQVSFPTTRAVFQRNNANQATFRITGYYTATVTRIEARVVARDGQGTTTDWRTIQGNPAGGTFVGDLLATGGWYNLEVRGMNGDQQVGNTTTVERVGVGEVFVVAGQSNAQGVHPNAPESTDDRVNCVNYKYPDDGFPNDPPVPQFSHLNNGPDFFIAPRGQGSWCWGRLGDLLAKRLNVPVMFFNAAWQGTPVRNWRESAPEGGVATSVYNSSLKFPLRQPYWNLKISLQYYANMLGVRSVLWHQGEADNFLKTPSLNYISDLQMVINQTRQDFGRNVSWVIARVSYGDLTVPPVWPELIAAQDNVIASGPNTFAGPNTDNIQIPRRRPPLNDPDAVHFDFDGLVQVADAWNASLSDSFFQNSTPIGPSPSPAVSVACGPNNNLTLTVNGNYPSVQWESGESGISITKSSGIYRAKVKDALGNTFLTGQVRISDLPAATVIDNRPPSVCAGSDLGLTANYDNVTWINQQTNANVATTRTFRTTTAGAYYVRYRDISGCDFTSNVVNVTVNPLPPTPVVSNEKSTTFCQGDNTVLRASNDNVQYNWSNGLQGKAVTIGASGSYFLTVTDQNGCTSAQSNTVVVVANPVPAKPVISLSGPTTFCADRTITLTAPENVAYQWSSGQTTRSLTINQSGNYIVQTRNQFGCTSVQSDAVSIKVNPLPQPPTVSASGATTFCEGNRVTLNASSPLDVIWSSGQIEKSITVSTSGNFTVQSRDQNGCLSPFSSILAVKVNPLPATPTIQSNKPPIICEGDRINLRVDGPYTVFWSTGDSTQNINTSSAGTYTARIRDVNGCISAQAGRVTVELRPVPPAPTINAIGTYTLQAVSSTNGTEFRWYRGTDSLTVGTSIIKAIQSGSYTARSSIVYPESLTCFSVRSAPFQFTVDLTNRGLSIYPNPNPDKVVLIETLADLVNAEITLYSLSGQVVATYNVPSLNERKQLVLTGVPSGSYIIRVKSNDFDVSKRIILGL